MNPQQRFIVTQQPGMVNQQQMGQQQIIRTSAPNSQVLQQRLLQKQVLVPQSELARPQMNPQQQQQQIRPQQQQQMVRQMMPMQQMSMNEQQQRMPMTPDQQHVVVTRPQRPMMGGQRPPQGVLLQGGQQQIRGQMLQQQRMQQQQQMMQQQQQMMRQRAPMRPEMAGQRPRFTHPQQQQQFQQRQILQQRMQQPAGQFPQRPQFEQMRMPGGTGPPLRLQIPPQGIPPRTPPGGSQQPSPALTPRSDDNDFDSSRGPTPTDYGEGPSDFNNGLEPPQKVIKRRPSQQPAKRRTSQNDPSLAAKKRARKGSKADETTDYDSYIESVMHQLKNLPAIPAVEPKLSHCYNACPIYGTGELPKTFGLELDTFKGSLKEGKYGRGGLENEGDYYNTMPFGNDPPVPNIEPVTITSRGFYKQEFENPPERNKFETMMTSDGQVVNLPPSPDLFYSSSPEPDYDASEERQQSTPPKTKEDKDKIWYDLDPEESDDETSTPAKLTSSRPKSPNMEIVHPIPIRPKPSQTITLKDLKLNLNKENNNILDVVTKSKLKSFLPSKNGGSFKAVTLTLAPGNGSAKSILKTLNNLAKILKIDAPKRWLHEDTKHGARDIFRAKGQDGKDSTPLDLQYVINHGSRFCRRCDLVISYHCVKVPNSKLAPLLSKTELEECSADIYFCDNTCYLQFSLERSNANEETKKQLNNLDDLINLQTKNKENEEMVKLEAEEAEKKAQREQERLEKLPKFKGLSYKNWNSNIANAKRFKPLNENELMQLMYSMGVTIMPPRETDDTRECLFCHIRGDAAADGPARLLNYDVDKWVHLNCALWSEEVYETVSGALVNVETALKSGANLYCKVCEKNGATVKCFKTRCTNYYHVGCAAKDRTMFYKNKSVFCHQHIPKGEKDQELTTLAVYRRVFIDRDENRLSAKVMDTQGNEQFLMRIGSMIFINVGQLLPHQLHNFHTADYIYPIGYKIIRYYWSTVHMNKRCPYICSINEVNNKPEFQIVVGEPIDGESDKTFKDTSARGVWMQILEKIEALRRENDLVKVFPQYISGEDLFGLTETNVVKVLESLPGIESLANYNFKYGRNPLLELPLAVNPSGCARSEQNMRTRVKRVHNFQRTTGVSSTPSSSLSRAAKEMVPTLLGLETTGPYSKNFVQSKSSQYRKMKQEWRQNVVLARSKIQGLGLYAARDIEKHQMIIEYIGELIRSDLTDIREKFYESQNRGIYMFRLDDDRVLDATMCGGMARYINHSCDPCCFTDIVEVDRDLHIIIFANRRINRGEELSYDYKFNFEDDNKIPCACGAVNCRKWMN